MTRALFDPDELGRLEDDLRVALRRQATSFRPVPGGAAAVRGPIPARRPRPWPAVAAVLVPVLVLAGILVVLAGGDGAEPRELPPAGDTGDPGDPGDTGGTDAGLPGPGVPHAVLDLPATIAVYGDEGEAPGAGATRAGERHQSFRAPGSLAGPMVFVATYEGGAGGELPTADPGSGARPVAVRGSTGSLARPHGPDGPALLDVDLGDGTVLSVLATGLADDEVVAVVDGLVARSDGGWDAPLLPDELAEVEPNPAAPDGAHWELSYGGEGADADLHLRDGAFEVLLRQRVAASAGPVEETTAAGVPAAVGAYRANDWWVLCEPGPGRAVELRITGDRDEVERVLAGLRWVDAATWRAAVPR